MVMCTRESRGRRFGSEEGSPFTAGEATRRGMYRDEEGNPGLALRGLEATVWKGRFCADHKPGLRAGASGAKVVMYKGSVTVLTAPSAQEAT